ncbi:MAG: hypothetical protein IJN90_03330 [Bacilli bacterium]|nr:hypothetical protein [Bacilli bacterium]
MLATLYIATTISSWIMTGIGVVAFAEKLKNDGYKMIQKEKTKSEKLLDNTRTAFYMLTPGLNFLVGYVLLFKFDEVYKKVMTDFVRDGKIVKNNEESENVDIDLQTKEMNNPKKYSDLSNEEKLALLEDEKKRLLREQSTGSESKSYNDRGAFTKRK